MAEKEGATNRRQFLSLASVGAAAAGVAAATGGAAQAAPVEPAAGEGYRETAHVMAYLDSCRF